MNPAWFADACAAAQAAERASGDIGTLGEKTLHAALKHYFAGDAESHEQKVGSFVADIVGENGIIEIQTRGFDKLRKKLTAFLDVCPVTVVYPVAKLKWLVWIDPQTGEVTRRRRSPKTGTVWEVFPELYRIKPFLADAQLQIQVVLLELEEQRLLNGWSRDKKKGSTRYERLPLALCEEVTLQTSADYAALLPESLPQPFTVRDLARTARISERTAQVALNIMTHLEAVQRVGKRGNAFLYEKVDF